MSLIVDTYVPSLIGALPPAPIPVARVSSRRPTLSPIEKAYLAALKAAEKEAIKEHKAALKAKANAKK